jgi:zinc protease
VKKGELEKVKRRVVADHIFSNQSASAMASSLATSYVATGDPYFDEGYVEKIQSVTPKDVLMVAQRYLRRDRMTVAVLTPPTKAPEVREDPVFRPPGDAEIVKRLLPSGMTLLTKKNDTVPIVTFQLFGRGGLLLEPRDKVGISSFTFDLLTKGTTKRSKTEIAQAMEEIGGTIQSGSGNNTFFAGVTVLKEDFDRGLEILADVATHPSFPTEEIEKQRHDTLLAIRRMDESWEREIERLFRQRYYGDHPYANDVLGTENSIRILTREDIVAFYQKLVLASNTVLAVFGDIDTDQVEAKVIKAFRDLMPGRFEPSPRTEHPWLIRDDRVENLTDKVSAALFVGYNGMTIHDRDRPVMDVIDGILSGIGYPSGRLHESLRGGSTSLVYYVHAFPSYGVDSGYFGVITQTTMQNYEQVLDRVLKNVEQIQSDSLSDEEIQRGKNMVTTMHELGEETNSAQAYRAALWEVLGLGFDWGEGYLERVEQVDREDISRVAKKYFQHHLIASIIPRKPVDTVTPVDQGEPLHVE